MKDVISYWEKLGNKLLKGKTIKKVTWQIVEEADEGYGWDNQSVKLHLNDGTYLVMQADDEGNDAGALLWINPKELVESKHFPGEKFTKSEVLPVFRGD